jgi:hypothetical protein
VVALRADGEFVEWRGKDCIDLDNIVPGLKLTVDQLFKSLAR